MPGANWGQAEWGQVEWAAGVAGTGTGTGTSTTIFKIDFSGGFITGAMNGGMFG